MSSLQQTSQTINPCAFDWDQSIGLYPELPPEDKKKLEQAVLGAPYELKIADLRHLLHAGFPFHRHDLSWFVHYLDLVDFAETNGHCMVGIDRKGLLLWVQAQRSFRNKGKLSLGRQRALNRIHFTWDAFEFSWQKQCQELKEYLAAGVTVRASRPLQCWMSITRKRWDQLPAHKQRQLESLGFPRSGLFLQNVNAKYLEELETLYALQGSLVGVTDCQQSFIKRMRKLYRLGTLDPSLKKRLDKVGIAWFKKGEDRGFSSVWEMRFAQAKAFVQECSGLIPPLVEWKDRTLANWMTLQFYDWDRRSPEQQERILSLGIKPRLSRKEQWEENYKQTLKLFQQLGSYERATYRKENPQVVRWVDRQIPTWTSLSPSEQAKLRSLGIEPKNAPLQSKYWEPCYQRAYHLLCGADQDSKAYTDRDRINSRVWLRTQVFRWNRLSPEQQHKLKPLLERIPHLNVDHLILRGR